MSLRLRLSLLTAFIILFALLFFGSLSYILFVRQQQNQLENFLQRDLQRLQSLLQSPEVGANLFQANQQGLTGQLVTNNGTRLPLTSSETLPFSELAIVQVFQGQPHLIRSSPWVSAEGTEFGTIRLALDISDAMRVRRNLLRSLLFSGAVITLIAIILGLYFLRNALTPLGRLASQARQIDPAKPEMIGLEKDFLRSKDEVADLALALDTTLEAIRNRQAEERAVLAEVAHELAAPLTLVAGHLESLSSEQADDMRLRAAKDAAKELLYTSQDLLTLARGELERPLNLEIFNLHDVANRISHEYHGVQFESSTRGEMAGSPERMAQVMRNLVRNAVQASSSHETVAIKLFEKNEQIVLEVHDQGLGLSEEDKTHIFERFYTKKMRGVGVGLNIVRSITEQHGGEVSVDSKLGKGTCFRVILPSLEAQID